jgi:large subunit ribosomal protein L35
MPKMKTHRGAAKRLKPTGSGKIKRKRAYRSHLMSNKTKKQKRHLKGSATAFIHEKDMPQMKRLLPYMDS